MDCTDIKALLSAILDGQLDPETRHETERHVASCSECRQLISQAEAADALIAADSQAMLADSSIDAEFEAAVLSRTVFAAGAGTLNRWMTWTGWVAAAASIALAAWIWILDHHRPGDFPGPTPIALSSDGSTVFAGLRRSFTTDESQPQEVFTLAGTSQPAAAATVAAHAHGAGERPTISRDDAETLYAASTLLDMLRNADDSSFADIEQVRRIAEYDQILSRLAAARSSLPESERPVVLAAESILLRTVRGPLSLDDVHELRDTVTSMGLSDELMRLAPAESSLDAAVSL